ncbi:MAG: LysE family transporter [Bacteroidetes bacterium]|nr:LysE family transporter [Bacteroidota bacterium]
MISAGPSFFYLIKVGIEKGFRKALMFALGIFISDVFLLSAIFIGLRGLFEDQAFRQVFSLASGILVVIFGITMLVRKKVDVGSNQEVKDLPYFMYAVKGIGINLFNPFTIIVWVTILGSVAPKPNEFIPFITGVLGVIFTSDVAKAYLAKLLGKLMTPRAVFILNKVMGLIFIGIGAFFIFLWYNSYFNGNDINDFQNIVPNLQTN